MLRILLTSLLAALVGAPAAAEPVELEGTWYVLVHFKDDNAPNAEQDRWEDKVWSFEKNGRRLKWAEYPIVVFDDEAGRFERRNTGQYARILHYWEPNPAQRADIRDGLQVNSRGSKQKSLRGSDPKGWSSARKTSAASASVVTYQEVWTIEGMPTLPVFERADFMSSGRTDSLEGLTRYATTKIEGAVISGSFERDGTRHGTFRMMPAGAVGALKGAATQKERQEKAQRQDFERVIKQSPQIRAQAQEDVKAGLAQAGIFVGRSDLERLSASAIDWSVQGVPPKEVEQRLGEQMISDYWSFAPKGAKPDETARYVFPFDPATPRTLLMGVGTDLGEVGRTGPLGQFEHVGRHTGFARYSFKFDMPAGTPVLAARAGKVERVVDGFKPPRGESLGGNPNAVWILHDDGTAALYLHLKDGVKVRPGDAVKAGDEIGRSGTPGYVGRTLLHFGVIRVDQAGNPQSVEIRFDDGTVQGVLPVAGKSYPGS